MYQSKIENRKYYYLLFALIIVGAFAAKFYFSQKRENQALRLKIMMLNKERRKPKPWGRLLSPAPVKTTATTQIQDTVSTGAAATLREGTRIESTPSNDDLAGKTTEELANLLNLRMARIKLVNFNEIQRTIQIADEIIAREPDSYAAYKAKLISLLVEEGKFSIPIDDNEVNSLLESMAAFDLSSDSVTRKEAALVSNANKEINQLAEQLNKISNQQLDVQNQMGLIGVDDPEYKILQQRNDALNFQETETMNKLTSLQDAVDNDAFPEEEYINEDVVQIPFMRMMARNDYSGVLENAETFVQQFPTSPIGYFYLILSLEKLGRKEEALDVIAKANLSTNDQNLLLQKLNFARSENPKNYWQKLNF